MDRNKLTMTDTLFLYLQHCVIKQKDLHNRDNLLAQLNQFRNSITYLHAFAQLYHIPLFNKQSEPLWVIWASKSK